jgi:hypothetical protein
MAASLPLVRALRPAVFIRRRAMRQGVFGPSLFWRSVAVYIIGRGLLRRTFGKQPDRLGRRRLAVGRSMSIAVYAPMTRKERKRTGTTRAGLEAAARADLDAARRAS